MICVNILGGAAHAIDLVTRMTKKATSGSNREQSPLTGLQTGLAQILRNTQELTNRWPAGKRNISVRTVSNSLKETAGLRLGNLHNQVPF